MKKVMIIGGGIGGLSLGFRLLGRAEVTILEKASLPGGNIRTTTTGEGFRVEWGPNGFLDSKPSLWQLCQDLGIGDQLIAASEGSRKFRFVCIDGRITALPNSPLSLLSNPLLSFRGKLRLLSEPFRPRRTETTEESVTAFATRRLGREACEVFMESLVTGIHAADPEQLSLHAAFPRLAQWEREHGSLVRGLFASLKQKKQQAKARGEKPKPQRMWSFRDGLQQLIDVLTKRLTDSIHTSVNIKTLTRDEAGKYHIRAGTNLKFENQVYDAVVLACPAFEQARLLESIPGAPCRELAEIEYNKITVVALGYRKEDAPAVPDGFGYIAPGRQRREVLGVQWCSAIFPDRAPKGYVLWRALVGGAYRPEVATWDDDTLVQRVHQEMQTVLHVRNAPAFHQIIRWPQAIPQYHLGHVARVRAIESSLDRIPGVYTAGNSLYGVAMNDVVERSNQIAAAILNTNGN